MAAPLTIEERMKLAQALQPKPAAAPVELPAQVFPAAGGAAAAEDLNAPQGWLPAAPVAGSTAELLGAAPMAAPAAAPPAPVVGALPAAPPIMGAPSPAALPAAPPPVKVDVAPPKPAAPAAAAPVGPKPAAVGGGPAPAGAPSAPTSLGPPKATTFEQKKATVLLPGEEEMQGDLRKAATIDSVWEDAKRDERIKGREAAAAEFERAIGEQEGLLAAQKAKDEEFSAWAAKDFAKRQALADEVANAKVDPARFWKNEAGVGRAMIAAVAGIFGVLGAPATGGKNLAVEEINKAIDKDINAQIAENENKKAGLAAKQNEYALRVKMFQDERLARASYMADAYRLVAKRIEGIAMKTENEEQKLEAARLKDYFDGQAKLQDDQFKLNVEKNYAAWQAAQAKAMQQAQAGMAAKADKYRDKIMDAEIEGAKTVLKEYPGAQLVVEGNHVVIVDPTTGKRIWAGSGAGGGKPGETTTVNVPVAQPGGGIAFQPTVVNKTGSAEVAKQAGGYTKAIQAIERMETAAAMPGPWTGKKKIAYEAALSDYISNYAVAKGMGAVSEDEGKRIAKTTVPTPTWGVGYMTDAEQEQLGAQKQALSAEAAGLSTAYGTPGTAGPAPIATLGAPVKK